MFDNIKSMDWAGALPPMPVGSVALLGAGPGDPLLVSLRAAVRIVQADAVVYDALANEVLLNLASERTERIYVGKRAGAHKMPQEQINSLLVDLAKSRKRVARLKGGDPLIFGRGGEEAEALAAAGVPFEIVPGITAAAGAAAYAGIPLTDRRFTSTLCFVTGHEDPTKEDSAVDYAALSKMGSLVLYMGLRTLARHAQALIAAGMSPQTPAAVVSSATLPAQRTVIGILADIADRATAAGLEAPALTLIGGAVSLRERINWFERLPLFGRTIAVTRTRQQASALSGRLAALGANVIEAATIELSAGDPGPIDEAMRNLPSYNWLIVTSVNGVDALIQAMRQRGLDARSLGRLKIGAIGSATAEALSRYLLKADVVPEAFVAEALARALQQADDFAGKRVLLFRADIARPALAHALRQLGAQCDDVSAYKISRPAGLPAGLKEALAAGRVDWITFTSSSTFANLREMLGADGEPYLRNVKLASIGPVTSETIRSAGLAPTVEADPYTIEALVEAIAKYERPGFGGRGSGVG
jgi:uroporphyrinogen III methyltransferase/synthase